MGKGFCHERNKLRFFLEKSNRKIFFSLEKVKISIKKVILIQNNQKKVSIGPKVQIMGIFN